MERIVFINIRKLFSSSSKTITIKINRDSVCMGDDINSHEKEITLSASISLKEFIGKLQERYIPSVAGPVAIWLLRINDKNICLFNQNGNSILRLDNEDKIIDNGNTVAFLKYYAQKDINELYNILKQENT